MESPVYWKNRRYMAWIALLMLLVSLVSMLFVSAPENNVSIIEQILAVLGYIVLTYMGGAALVDAVKGLRS